MQSPGRFGSIFLLCGVDPIHKAHFCLSFRSQHRTLGLQKGRTHKIEGACRRWVLALLRNSILFLVLLSLQTVVGKQPCGHVNTSSILSFQVATLSKRALRTVQGKLALTIKGQDIGGTKTPAPTKRGSFAHGRGPSAVACAGRRPGTRGGGKKRPRTVDRRPWVRAQSARSGGRTARRGSVAQHTLHQRPAQSDAALICTTPGRERGPIYEDCLQVGSFFVVQGCVWDAVHSLRFFLCTPLPQRNLHPLP